MKALLAPWTGPWTGVPPFGQFKAADIKPALEAAMAENLAEIDRIAADPAAPTFDNTIAAMERSGKVLDRVGSIYGIYVSTMDDAEMQAIETEMSPKLAAFTDQIVQNSRLFAQLASLYTRFSQNILAEESTQMVLLDSEGDLAGLPAALRESAAQAAASHGQPGKWAVINTRSSVDPFLTWSARRDLREKVWRMFTSRGDNGDAHDNNQIISEILALRAQRATLLGYATHAHWRIEDQMAKTPERAVALMEAVWKPAVARVREEVADMQAIADRDHAGIRIAPWDYHFYMEKVRKAKYDLDENDLKPYLQMEKLREGMFWVAGQLFGFRFQEKEGVPVYH